jgi:hypothetical protein
LGHHDHGCLLRGSCVDSTGDRSSRCQAADSPGHRTGSPPGPGRWIGLVPACSPGPRRPVPALAAPGRIPGRSLWGAGETSSRRTPAITRPSTRTGARPAKAAATHGSGQSSEAARSCYDEP